MCGIFGVLRFDGAAVTEQELLGMGTRLHHRGPDDGGVFADGWAGLGARRLSIIDVRDGHQPMFTADERWVIVFNGEVYNFLEIREELLKAGTRFRTRSDTETLLYGYVFWGEEVLDRLNGMFAFSILDRQKGELFLARDRLGEKQIYFTRTDSYFVFGSEMKIPLEYSHAPRRLRMSALPEFLTYQYVGGAAAPVEGIDLLREGHCMTLTRDREFRMRKYWDLGLAAKRQSTIRRKDDAVDAVVALLRDSVRLRLTSDVPVSVMLSSGLDSSAIAYLLKEELHAPLACFSVGLADSKFDESRDAADLARRFGLPWRCTMIDGPAVLSEFDRYVDHIDSLQGNTGQLVYYFACKSISEAGFKVSLNGNGGDELFAGYPTYRATMLHRLYRRAYPWFQRLTKAAVDSLPPRFGRVSFDYKLKKFCECPFPDHRKAHGYWRTVVSSDELHSLLRRSQRDDMPPFTALYDRAFAELGDIPGRFIRPLIAADLSAWLTPMLPWVDNVSMAHSVELRLPYLDHRLIELVLSLPETLIFDGWELKKILRQFLSKKFPRKVWTRGKRGTHLPVGQWLNTSLRALADHYLDTGVLNREGLFNMEAVTNLLRSHRERRADNTFKLWNLIIFSAWKEHFRITVEP